MASVCYLLTVCGLVLVVAVYSPLVSAQTEEAPTEALTLENTTFTMIPEESKDWSSSVVAEYWRDDIMLPLTLCLWVWPLTYSMTSAILNFMHSHNSMDMNAIEGRISASVNQTCPTPFYTPRLQQHIWHHLCLTVTPSNLTLHYQNLSFTQQVSDMEICPMPNYKMEGPTLILGMDQGSYAFSGQFSRVRLYEQELGEKEVEELLECRPGPADFLIASNVSVQGKVVQEATQLREMCTPPPEELLALFHKCANHLQARDFCSSMGGRLINHEDDYKKMTDLILKSQDADESSIVVWTSDMATEAKEYAVVLSISREGHMFHTPEYSCSYILSITVCMVPYGKTVYLKVNDINKLSMYQYNNKLILQSENGIFITRRLCHELSPNNHSQCLLYDGIGMPQEHSVLENEQTLLGRHSFKRSSPNQSRNVTLTMCEMDSFTCDDGQCIPLVNRCDGLANCIDQSDEGPLCHILEAIPTSYWKTVCPGYEPVVDLLVNVIGVNSVSLDTNEFQVALSITTSWRDNRLTFLNLQNSTNNLDPYTINRIWMPTCTYDNAGFQDNLHLQTKTSVLEMFSVKATTVGTSTITDSYEVLRYRGSETVISWEVQYLFTASCSYNFFTFPFDTQECFLTMKLNPGPSCQPVWNMGSQGIRVVGKATTLSIYSIPYPRFSSSNPEEITLRFLFSRRYEAYLLTTFLPCIVLCILSQVTLSHFQLEDFTDRITVTLSLLIVLASLFSQLSSSLPSSPVPKLVDFFFFYCIVRVGLIFLFHSCIIKSINTEQEEEVEEKQIASITGKEDLLMNIKMKIAWPLDNQSQRRRGRLVSPRGINIMGFFTTVVMDVVVAALLVFWAVEDHNSKYHRFHAYNQTQ